ncbi:MAG: DUF1049 domain-containing protein [Sphingomonadaceae bacterium]|nr:DUF1049 domain-containing protein [Sphingomonadaceae bacterium]
MNFLKTLGWVVLTVLVVVFSIDNWTPVDVNLWGNLQARIKLPILMLLSFLLGLVPALVYYRTKSWRATRRLSSVERELEDVRGFRRYSPPTTPEAPSAEPVSQRIGAGPAGPVRTGELP